MVVPDLIHIVTFPQRKIAEFFEGFVNGAIDVLNKLGLGIEKISITPLFDQVNNFIVKKIFDPEEERKNQEVIVKDAEKTLLQLVNQRDGILNAQEAKEKAAREKAAADKKAAAEKEAADLKAATDKAAADRLKNEQEISDLLDKLYQENVKEFEAAEKAKIEAAKLAAEEQEKLRQQELANAIALKEGKIQLATDSLNIISNLAAVYGKGDEKRAKRAFQIQKAVSIAQATIETYKGATAAFASTAANPITIGFPAAPFIAAGAAIAIDASQAVSFTNAPTVTGGTANGVAYLNGSKVLTTGSALVFNGSNFALGVSPSTNSANTSIEINKAGNGLSVFSNTDFRMSRNVYDDGAKYARSSETAVTYRLGNGTFEWYNAPTGTAGSAISFTQAMTLDASGNLCVGTTTAQNRLTIVDSNSIHNGTIHLGSTSYYAKIFQDAASDGGVIYNSYAVSGTAHGHKFHINGTERARIDSSGNLLVGTTTSAGSGLTIVSSKYIWSVGTYNNTTANAANMTVGAAGDFQRSTSALKYKQDIRDLENIDVNVFRAVRYKSKCTNDDQSKDHFGIIADEVHSSGISELVNYSETGEVEGFQYERLTVVLLKAIQELKAEFDAYKASHP